MLVSTVAPAMGKEPTESTPTLGESKELGRARSRFLRTDTAQTVTKKHASSNITQSPEQTLQPNLAVFESTIKPLLKSHCVDCHGPDSMEGNIRLDTLNPDLLAGGDTDWWTEVFAVITKGEMPPPEAEPLSEDAQRQVVEWLAAELQTASIARRRAGGHSAFRRLTRYEYNYALQDLLGLPWDFAKDLPPEAHSEEGFENSSDLLHLSVSQFETYHRIAHSAITRATVLGQQPPSLRWFVTMQEAAEREWSKHEKEIEKLKKDLQGDPEKLAKELEQRQKNLLTTPRGAYYKELSTARMIQTDWDYPGAKYAFKPIEASDHDQVAAKHDEAKQDVVAVLPPGQGARLIVELGNRLPDEGMMRVIVRAASVNATEDRFPSLQLWFGWQASNEGRALLRVSESDVVVTADATQPQTIQWDVPLGEIYPRNNVRKTSPMGALPSPSEYIRLVNSSATPLDIQVFSVEVIAPVFDQWPPPSHRTIFAEAAPDHDESIYARDTIAAFMKRAWRRPITEVELARKCELYAKMRSECETCEEAIIEVLATVLSSPQFLYVTSRPAADFVMSDSNASEVKQDVEGERGDDYALANRLALFLWCSIPDQELLQLADSGTLHNERVLMDQVQRMLKDPRSKRLAKHFVHQWLDLQLLDFLNFKQHQRGFDPLLKEAMQYEPVAMFEEVLKNNTSLLDFIHSDYAMVNERLARHYGLTGVHGNEFRKVPLHQGYRRGGLLTQAGVLAMNSDWPDSHPLKRAIWLLESVLGDPPPPPPPAVPQIDLANPEIAKMTLKERIEDHRNHAACMSCHVKIDPWGIAFENYDALGQWRDKIQDKPIDASSELFNHQTLEGMEGLKRFLLLNRQDQFVQATVTKLATYALGRPLAFSDRAEIDAITAKVRREGDGLKTVIEAIVQSKLFRSPS